MGDEGIENVRKRFELGRKKSTNDSLKLDCMYGRHHYHTLHCGYASQNASTRTTTTTCPTSAKAVVLFVLFFFNSSNDYTLPIPPLPPPLHTKRYSLRPPFSLLSPMDNLYATRDEGRHSDRFLSPAEFVTALYTGFLSTSSRQNLVGMKIFLCHL